MARTTINSISYPFEAPIREACEDAQARIMRDDCFQYSVCIAPSKDGRNPRVWIGKFANAPEGFVALSNVGYKGAWSLEHNFNAIKERMRSAPIYATSFRDSQGYAAECTFNQINWRQE